MVLKILRVAERIPPLSGGKEIHVAELTRAQATLGNIVHLVYRDGDPSAIGVRSTRIRVPSFMSRAPSLVKTSLFAYRALRSVEVRGEYDLIHAHGDLAEALLIGRLARIQHTPFVLTVHGQLNARYRALSRIAFRRVDTFVALGNRVKEDLVLCGVEPGRIITMSSGLDMVMIEKGRCRAVRTPGLIVAAGSLDRVKNLEMTINCILGLPSEIDVTLEIIGDGRDRDRLQKVAGNSPRIRFLGGLTRLDLYRRVAASDAFVISSKRIAGKGEGVPTVLLEAMALGALCIVSTQASPEPVVLDRSSYWSFDPSNPAELSFLLLSALTNPSNSSSARIRAIKAVESLSWPEVAARMQLIYAQALQRNLLDR